MQSVALDSISVKGFKSLASIDSLRLDAINLLIGANGSGKSNFIGIFSFLHAVREARLQDYVRKAGGADQILHFGSKRTQSIDIHISFQEKVSQYRLVLSPTDDDSLFPADERLWFWDKARYPNRPYETSLFPAEDGREAGISRERQREKIADWIRLRLGQWRLYHVHDTSASSPMRKTAKTNDNRFLRADGSNLPAFLYLLKSKHPESYELVRQSVRSVAPFFDDFSLEPELLNEETIRLTWKHQNSDQYFSASALSDGSLRFIFLATLFLQPLEYKPSVILVDEPELGLHPYAITLLSSLVHQASHDTQVILSTQSALLLDHFQPQHVLVAERRNDATHIERLETSLLDEWLGASSLGQLWEKNEIGGRPR